MSSKDALEQVLTQRWAETQERVAPMGPVRLTWDIGNYEHFDTPRGFAVTFNWGKPHCHLRFARKLLRAQPDRIDGIVQHELGHVVDLTTPKATLDRWALSQGIQLPSTEERRADALAQAIWGKPIRYDDDLVQSTHRGTFPRPVHLGL